MIELRIRKTLLNKYLYIFIALVALLYVFVYSQAERKSVYDINDTSFVGTLKSYTIKGNKLTMFIDAKESLKTSYYISTEEELNDLRNTILLGSTVTFTGTLSEPLNNTVPNTFNYKEYLYNHEIYYTCLINKFELDDSNIGFLYKIKNTVIKRIISFEDISDYLLTFIIGDKSLIDDEVFNEYRENGVTHLFAISGMHIGLFSACLLFLFKKMGIKENKRYMLTVAFIWFYAFLTSFSPSVLRAGLLFSLLALNKIFYTEVKSLYVLILTGSILLLVKPLILFDIGFEYSFLTTFGLIYSSEYLKNSKLLGTSMCAMMFSLPLTINNYFKFNLLTIVFNVIFVPFVSSLVYPLCLITFFFSFLEPLTSIVLNIMEGLNKFCAGIDFLNVIVPKLNIILLIIYYIVLLSLINKKFKLCMIILYSIIFLNKFSPYLDSNYYVEFIDVGQGDSIVIRTPHNKEVILVDTGGTVSYDDEPWKKKKKFYVSDNTITYLNSLGISKINLMVLTHGDNDHLGDAIHIMENMKVKNVKLNIGEYNYAESQIIKSGVNIVKKYNSDLDLTFLYIKEEADENSNSQILLLKIYKSKILLMGDSPRVKELEVLEKYDLKNTDIIKLGHHGSRTSSDETFLNSINAGMAIISSGRNNKFGHPHGETIDTLYKLGIEYLNTQTSGTISYKLNKNEVTYTLCKP